MKGNLSTLKFISEVTGRKKINIVLLLVIQIIQSIITLLYAVLVRDVINQAVSGNIDGFVKYIAIYTILIAFQILLRAVERFLQENTISTFENKFKDRLFLTLLTKDYQSVSKIHSGEWMNRLTSDAQVVADGMTSIVPGIVGTIIRITGAIGILLYMEPKFAFILIPGGLMLIGFTYCFRKVLKRMHKKVQEKSGKVRAFMQENLESAMIVRAFAVETESAEEARHLMNEHQNERMKRNRFSNICNIGFSGAINGAYVFGLAYCGYGLLNKTMSYGDLMAVLQLIAQVQSPFASITGYIPKYYAMMASAERLMEAEQYDDAKPVHRDIEEIKSYYENKLQQICLEHISFAYDEDNQVLNDFSLTIEKGEFIAFTGMSGCGKSTVLKLLLGLYKADSGNISVDSSFRKLYAYVPQGNLLMSGTIRNIISMANTKYKADDEKIKDALCTACAEFVYELPDGVETELGERGLGLSEGQMQRLAVARALFSESPVLILDEATSALDEMTEKQLLENIKSLKNKTVLIVTHRPAALSVCDKRISFGDDEDD